MAPRKMMSTTLVFVFALLLALLAVTMTTAFVVTTIQQDEWSDSRYIVTIHGSMSVGDEGYTQTLESMSVILHDTSRVDVYTGTMEVWTQKEQLHLLTPKEHAGVVMEGWLLANATRPEVSFGYDDVLYFSARVELVLNAPITLAPVEIQVRLQTSLVEWISDATTFFMTEKPAEQVFPNGFNRNFASNLHRTAGSPENELAVRPVAYATANLHDQHTGKIQMVMAGPWAAKVAPTASCVVNGKNFTKVSLLPWNEDYQDVQIVEIITNNKADEASALYIPHGLPTMITCDGVVLTPHVMTPGDKNKDALRNPFRGFVMLNIFSTQNTLMDSVAPDSLVSTAFLLEQNVLPHISRSTGRATMAKASNTTYNLARTFELVYPYGMPKSAQANDLLMLSTSGLSQWWPTNNNRLTVSIPELNKTSPHYVPRGLEYTDNVVYRAIDGDWEKDYLRVADMSKVWSGVDKSAYKGGSENVTSVVLQFAGTYNLTKAFHGPTAYTTSNLFVQWKCKYLVEDGDDRSDLDCMLPVILVDDEVFTTNYAANELPAGQVGTHFQTNTMFNETKFPFRLGFDIDDNLLPQHKDVAKNTFVFTISSRTRSSGFAATKPANKQKCFVESTGTASLGAAEVEFDHYTHSSDDRMDFETLRITFKPNATHPSPFQDFFFNYINCPGVLVVPLWHDQKDMQNFDFAFSFEQVTRDDDGTITNVVVRNAAGSLPVGWWDVEKVISFFLRLLIVLFIIIVVCCIGCFALVCCGCFTCINCCFVRKPANTGVNHHHYHSMTETTVGTGNAVNTY